MSAVEHVQRDADDCPCDGCEAARRLIKDLRAAGVIAPPTNNDKKKENRT